VPERIRQAARLRADGLISDDEYESKRQELVSQL
jgi:hypothetical protein